MTRDERTKRLDYAIGFGMPTESLKTLGYTAREVAERMREHTQTIHHLARVCMVDLETRIAALMVHSQECQRRRNIRRNRPMRGGRNGASYNARRARRLAVRPRPGGDPLSAHGYTGPYADPTLHERSVRDMHTALYNYKASRS